MDPEYIFVAVGRIPPTIFAKQKLTHLRTNYIRRILPTTFAKKHSPNSERALRLCLPGDRWCDVLGFVLTHAPQQFGPFETQLATCDGGFARQSIYSFISLHSSMSRDYIHIAAFEVDVANINTCQVKIYSASSVVVLLLLLFFLLHTRCGLRE